MVVDAVEVALCLLFMAEDLDDLLAVHHLLDEALRLTDGALLFEEVSARTAADDFGDEGHRDDAHNDDERQIQAVIEHHHEER